MMTVRRMQLVIMQKMERGYTRCKSRRSCWNVQDAMPVKQAWSAPQPISPTPGNLALQCSDIPQGGISQASCSTGVGNEALKKAPGMASHREKCLDCSAQPEQTPVKMAEQQQGKTPSSSITATSGGEDWVPADPRLRSMVQQEVGEVTGSGQGGGDGDISCESAVGSAPCVRRNLLENELSDAVVGPGKDGGAIFSPCDTTSGSGENSPEERQLMVPRGDGGFPGDVLIPTHEGLGPVSPEGSDRELYQEKDSALKTKGQPEKSSVRNGNSQILPPVRNASVVDYGQSMQDKVPLFLRDKVGLNPRCYPVEQPEWGQKLPTHDQDRGHRYGPPPVRSQVRPGQDSSLKAHVFPRPRGHQHSVSGPVQFRKPGPPHVHPSPRMPYGFQQRSTPPTRLPPPQYPLQQTCPSQPPQSSPPTRQPPPHYPSQQISPSGPPHPSPPRRLPPPHYPPQQTSPSRPPHPSPPRRLPPHQQTSPSRHPPSPCRPSPLSPRRGCGQTPPRPPMSNLPPRPHRGPPQHFSAGGFASTRQHDKDAEVNNNNYADDFQYEYSEHNLAPPMSNLPSRPHHGPHQHFSAGGFASTGQHNKDAEVNDNYASDFRHDYSEHNLAPHSYPGQGRGMVRGCSRRGGRGQPYPNPARGRAGLGGYTSHGGCPQRGRGGIRGRGFMAGAVHGRGRAQPAW